jgi:hypothetical protein
MMSCRKTVVLALAGAVAAPVAAFQPLATDDTGTQGASGNQVEFAYLRQRQTTSGSVEKTDTQTVPLVLTRGFSDALDLYLGAASQRIATTDAAGSTAHEGGRGNVAIGAKWRFFEGEDSGFSLGVKPEVQLPVTDEQELRGLGSGRASWSTALLASRKTGFGEIHFNLVAGRANYALESTRVAHRSSLWRASVAPVWQATEQLKLALDIGIVTNPHRSMSANKGYALLGAIYSPGDDLDLAFGLSREHHDGNATTVQGQLGLTWRFK